MLAVLSIIASVVSIVGAFIAAYQAWATRSEAQRERERLNQRIAVVLRDRSSGERVPLRIGLRREHLTRAELLGLLGMKLRDGVGSYDLKYKARPEFLEQLERHQEGEGPAEFVIPATSEEIAQFRVKKERPATPAPAEEPGAEAAESEMALQSRPGGQPAPSSSA